MIWNQLYSFQEKICQIRNSNHFTIPQKYRMRQKNADDRLLKNIKVNKYILIFLVLLFITTGQTLVKMGSRSIHLEDFSFAQFFNIFIVFGFICMYIRGLIWLYTLKSLPLSFAYPFISLSFVLILFISYFFFHETVSAGKILGSFFIIAGVIFNSFGEEARKNKKN